MKKEVDVVILCGGKGSRLYPLTGKVPKPMVKIGDLPVLEHLIKYYQYYGYRNFKLLLGYKGESIKDYFKNRYKNLHIEYLDTGINTNTAERIWQIKDKLPRIFLLSYADVLANINLKEEMAFHLSHKKVGTMSIVPLKTSYGVVKFDSHSIATNYLEKPIFYDRWINAGFFIFNSTLFNYWSWESKDFSQGMLVKLAKLGLLGCFKHYGFWSGMDTVRENSVLNELWNKGEAKWALWRK